MTLAIDAYAAQLMGFSIRKSLTFSMLNASIGTADLSKADIIELNRDTGSIKLTPSGKVRQLAAHIVEDSACSACYGSLIYALERLHEKGLLSKLKDKLYIGQGHKNKSHYCVGIGIGSCTSGFEKHVGGCPPKARDIVEYLESLILRVLYDMRGLYDHEGVYIT